MRFRALAAVLAGGALACAAQPALAATPASYADGARDAARRAPEVTTVVVSNDDAGAIRFRINVANQPQLARDSALELFLDTDQSPATGDPLSQGADYRIAVDGATQSFEFGRWDGTHFDASLPSDTVKVWYWSGVSIAFNRSELGDTSALAFWVRGAGPEQAVDAAPNQGTWAYQFQTGSVNPRDVDAFYYRVVPSSPRAGTGWQLRVDSLRLADAGGTAVPDRWSCAATLGGRTLRGTGAGGCSFRLPKSARGKKLVVTISVSFQGEVVTGTAAFRVR